MNKDPKLKETVLSNLRSVTQSCKGGVPIDRLERDYKDLLGQPIPYRELGYNTLQAFIYSIPEVITIERNHLGQLVLLGKADESTAHIVSLVSRQKNENKRPKPKPKPYRSSGYTGYRPSNQRFNSNYNSRPSFEKNYNRNFSSSNSASRHVAPSRPKPNTLLPTPSLLQQQQPLQERSEPISLPKKPPSVKPRPPPRGYEIAPRFLNRLNREIQQIVDHPTSPTHSFNFAPVRRDIPSPKIHASSPTIGAPSPAIDAPSPTIDAPSPPLIGAPVPTSYVAAPLPVYKAPLSTKDVSIPQSSIRIPSPVRPSHNPVSERPLHLPNPDTDPIQYVKAYAKQKGISVEYKTKKYGQRQKSFITSLQLGTKSYNTYEIDTTLKSKEEAEIAAARLAIADIKSATEPKDLFPVTLIDNAECQQLFLDRILTIVCEKPTGMFCNGVLREYEIRFKETLPDNWLDMVKKNTYLEVEVPYGTQLPKDIYILRRPRDPSSGCTTPSSTSSKNESFDAELDAATLSNSIANLRIIKVPPITLPLGNQWSVFITNVDRTTSLACRLVNYADEFAEMSEQMRTFYSTRSYPVQSPIENHLYAASFDDDEDQLWHRVLIDSIGDSGQISCYFVDDGDIVEMNTSNLQEIDAQFQILPYQALHMKLDELEDYEDVVKQDHLKHYLLGESLVAEVLRIDDVYTVILYNTSGENDVNLNQVIRELTISESLKWELPEIGTTSIAYLTHITEKGEIYLRFNNPHLSILEAEIGRLSSKFEEAVESVIRCALHPNTMCAAKYIDDTWYRALFLGYTDSNNSVANVLFVDYGKTEQVSSNRICELEPADKFLASDVPYQAVQCRLHKVAPADYEWTKEAVKKLTELVPYEDEVMIKVETQAEDTKLPAINLFKRNKESYIISINETLASTPELFRKSVARVANMSLNLTTVVPSSHLKMQSPTSELRSLSKSIPDVALSADEQFARRHVEQGSTGDNVINWVETPDISSPLDANEQLSKALAYAEIPEVGQDFDILVIEAASPSNFVVQPYKSGRALDELMANMMSFYKDEENLCPMHFSLLKENYCYAALHKDNVWYRVRVNKVMPGEPVMAIVHFVDYGDFGTVVMSKIQFLWRQFKSLPCQAIKATLSDIRPVGLDWNPMQCVQFQELVKQKPFVSIVKKKQVSDDVHFPTVVSLWLIDTSEQSDICINDLLVQKKMAMAT